MRVFRRHPHWRLPVAIVLAGLIGITAGGVLYVHPTFGGGKATAAALPTSVRTLPGHTVTRLKKVRVRVIRYRHGKRIVSFKTVTRPVSVFVPAHTVEVTGPGRTVVHTTVRTLRLPGTTRTETITHTTTLPGPTVTDTTISTTTETTIVTGPTTTVTCIVDTNGTTIGGCS